MKRGDVVQMKSCTAIDGRNRFTFGPPADSPKGTTMVFVFLGNQEPGEAFDAAAVFDAMGWMLKPEFRTTN